MIISHRKPGISFITRCHNEQDNIVNAITSLEKLRVPYEIIIILHRSTDSSQELVFDLADKFPISIVKYSKQISRAGYETLITPAHHPNSLISYVNWCFSHAKHNWIFRWDADFVATDELINFLNSLDPAHNDPTVYKIRCDLGDHITAEHYLNNCLHSFKKFKFWEIAEYNCKNPKFKWPENNATIISIPRTNLKKYWDNRPWFNETNDKDLCGKMFLLEFLAGQEPKGFGACCYKVEDYKDQFLKIDKLEHHLKHFDINFYS